MTDYTHRLTCPTRHGGSESACNCADAPPPWESVKSPALPVAETRLDEMTYAEVRALSDPEPDVVNHPPHYTSHPSGVECIQVTEHMGFNLGNAVKYIWRADEKGNALEDLKKARWYVDREIARRERSGS